MVNPLNTTQKEESQLVALIDNIEPIFPSVLEVNLDRTMWHSEKPKGQNLDVLIDVAD